MRTRREVLALLGAAAGVATLGVPAFGAGSKEVARIAAVMPLSGPWARNGEMLIAGARLAAADINAAGGIAALNGTQVEIVPVDTEGSVQSAVAAAQKLSTIDQLVGATGAYLSSFTLAATEVTERAKVPWLTLAYADKITDRGYKYVFQSSAVAGEQAKLELPVLLAMRKNWKHQDAKTVGIVMDNTAINVALAKYMTEVGFEAHGLKMLFHEIYTPPLKDATSLIMKVRQNPPDILFLWPTSVPDTKLLLQKMGELGVGASSSFVSTAGDQMGASELPKVTGKGNLDSVLTVTANWPGKGLENLVDRFKKASSEPWMAQGSLSTYGHIWVLKQAMEDARSMDRTAIADAIHKMDTTTGPARYFPGGRLKFLPNGRRADAGIIIFQWQDGVPQPVYPENLATSSAKFG